MVRGELLIVSAFGDAKKIGFKRSYRVMDLSMVEGKDSLVRVMPDRNGGRNIG